MPDEQPPPDEGREKDSKDWPDKSRGGGRGQGRGGTFSGRNRTEETRDPTEHNSWVRPGHAVGVVALVGFFLVVVVGAALWVLVQGPDTTQDPNTETIAAIATAGISALSSLAAAYFGIRVASEGATQATETARHALNVAESAQFNSSGQRPPNQSEF